MYALFCMKLIIFFLTSLIKRQISKDVIFHGIYSDWPVYNWGDMFEDTLDLFFIKAFFFLKT